MYNFPLIHVWKLRKEILFHSSLVYFMSTIFSSKKVSENSTNVQMTSFPEITLFYALSFDVKIMNIVREIMKYHAYKVVTYIMGYLVYLLNINIFLHEIFTKYFSGHEWRSNSLFKSFIVVLLFVGICTNKMRCLYRTST